MLSKLSHDSDDLLRYLYHNPFLYIISNYLLHNMRTNMILLSMASIMFTLLVIVLMLMALLLMAKINLMAVVFQILLWLETIQTLSCCRIAVSLPQAAIHISFYSQVIILYLQVLKITNPLI